MDSEQKIVEWLDSLPAGPPPRAARVYTPAQAEHHERMARKRADRARRWAPMRDKYMRVYATGKKRGGPGGFRLVAL